MSKEKKYPKNTVMRLFRDYRLMLVSCGFIILTSVITYILYIHTTDLLTDRLRDRIKAIAGTAAIQFEPEDILAVKGFENMEDPEFAKLVQQLRDVQNANTNIQFAYLMRRTDDPLVLEFIADSYSLADSEELDENNNGVLDEDEIPPAPGDPYDIEEFPVLRDEAFFQPSADRMLLPDKWGLMMSAYAPILDAEQNAIAIIGIDVIVDDFTDLTQATLLPFLLFIVFLTLLLSLLTFSLMRIYTERVEVVKDLDRQKDELLGIVAHQLAKPITAIRWDLESLLDGDMGALNAEQKTEAQMMKNQAVGLADLVSMILDVSRIQLGRIQFEPKPLDLNELFKEMLDVIKPTIADKKIDFIKKMPANLPTVLLDKRYTRMTIENLLTNAVKYTPEGGKVTLDVKIENGVMHCKVSDTGCGIPKADQGKIFGKMYRASNVVNTVDGNGFGLYVAKGAVEGQGGKIGFESIEGKGTTFFFTLPMKEAPTFSDTKK